MDSGTPNHPKMAMVTPVATNPTARGSSLSHHLTRRRVRKKHRATTATTMGASNGSSLTTSVPSAAAMTGCPVTSEEASGRPAPRTAARTWRTNDPVPLWLRFGEGRIRTATWVGSGTSQWKAGRALPPGRNTVGP